MDSMDSKNRIFKKLWKNFYKNKNKNPIFGGCFFHYPLSICPLVIRKCLHNKVKLFRWMPPRKRKIQKSISVESSESRSQEESKISSSMRRFIADSEEEPSIYKTEEV